MPELTATKPTASTPSQRINRIPLATYRLQLGPDLNLEKVRSLLPYLQQLGISDLYLSPLFRSRVESSHGYDVVDHGTIDPAIGNLDDFERLAEAVRAAGMGILLDVVPNHMGINDPGNLWWLDVLENGEGSYFADFFDIDWRPAASALQDKVLLPFLGEPFGSVLENGQLQVVYSNSRLQLQYCERRLPLAPSTWPIVLDIAAAQREAQPTDGDPNSFSDWAELQSIITQLRNLPPGSRRDHESMEERYREQLVVRRRLTQLLDSSPAVKAALNAALVQINGEKGSARSFDTLEKLLEQQWYRLAYWRVAADEINYRRFFDINDLAAIRVEDPRVFEAVHRLVRRLIGAGWVTGLRIDHPDGLRDPLAYFKNLHALYRSQQPVEDNEASEIYVVAEKILSGDEPLSTDWPVAGTTGYDWMNAIGRLQVNADGLTALREFYDRYTGNTAKPADVIYESKRAVLFSSMSSELQMLGASLYRIAQSHRASRDFTRPVLQRALREVIASMTVYRTYVRGDSWDVSESDYRTVTFAVRMAKRRNRSLPVAVFDFISSVLLLEHPPTVSDEQAADRRAFALKLQQVTGPVAAKGVEDTAFYRYYPLASLNEVGGELDAKPLALDEFHRLMRHRNETWSHSMSGTATHDTKRGEDLRARLHVLSECPDEWIDAIGRWKTLNEPFIRELDGDPVPDANEQYLLYQTLVGTWPADGWDAQPREPYRDRIIQYMHKALREAKIHTSWMNPSESYEAAVGDFITDLLGDGGDDFQKDISEFAAMISDSGFVNSLAQVLLKITLPGVPDFYQGTELWDFNLVDPDNRRPVDFDLRRRSLERLQRDFADNPEEFFEALTQRWPSADVKLWITTRALAFRRERPDLFTFGECIPLTVTGQAADHILAFARRCEDQWAIVVVPRQIYRLQLEQNRQREHGAPRINWQDTRLVLPPDAPTAWRCEISNQTSEAIVADTESVLNLSDAFNELPISLLAPQSSLLD
jgi:(1->4)-alpha-D-glucan 1-alpha-D-glucosylmutase